MKTSLRLRYDKINTLYFKNKFSEPITEIWIKSDKIFLPATRKYAFALERHAMKPNFLNNPPPHKNKKIKTNNRALNKADSDKKRKTQTFWNMNKCYFMSMNASQDIWNFASLSYCVGKKEPAVSWMTVSSWKWSYFW